MLILSRKAGEKIVIGEGTERIEIEVTRLTGSRVLLGVTAPRAVQVVRGELPPRAEAGPEVEAE